MLIYLCIKGLSTIFKQPKRIPVFTISVAIVSLHFLAYFSILLFTNFSIWFPNIIRFKTQTDTFGLDLGFSKFVFRVLILYIVNIAFLLSVIVNLCKISNK